MNGPDYRERRIMRQQERTAHRKAAPRDCQCVDCLGVEGFHRALMAKVDAERAQIGEAPF